MKLLIADDDPQMVRALRITLAAHGYEVVVAPDGAAAIAAAAQTHPDLIMLDPQGYLAYYQRRREGDALQLMPPQRIFHDEKGDPLRLNEREAGKSGRRKFTLTDWDQDGRLDLLINSKNIDFYRNTADAPNQYRFTNQGQVHPRHLAGHTTSPTTVDWDHNNIPDLIIGAEDGFLYYLKNPTAKRD